MEEPDTTDTPDFLSMTGAIVVGYLGNNSVRISELPQIIASVHASLVRLGAPKVEEPAPENLKPAVSIKKSITDQYLISLEDGKKYKTLKRHLSGRGMTFAEYKAKWGLPRDYPSVAPGYAAHRSNLAKAAGLGRIVRGTEAALAEAPIAPEPAPTAAPEPAKRGRPRKVKEPA